MTKDELIAAHKHSGNHRAEVEASAVCGCFYCESTYAPAVKEWIKEKGGGETALCQVCGIDAVIGDKSGLAITPAFLAEMHAYWFDR